MKIILTIKVIGLLLAILDFTGLSKSLESAIDRIRDSYKDWIDGWKESIPCFVNICERDSDFEYVYSNIGCTGILLMLCIVLGCIIFHVTFLGPLIIASDLSDTLAGFLYYLAEFGLPFLFFYTLYVILFLIWGMLHIINIPKSGTLCTIGLLIALADSLFDLFVD